MAARGERSDKILSQRGVAKITGLRVESRMELDEAQRRCTPIHAWLGKEKADTLAGEAAAAHRIADAQVSCFDWAGATATLGRQRLIPARTD
eukprot:3770464-Pyramimonas_sp.AAC.1